MNGPDFGFDLVCVGRTCVDLYAEQNDAHLEDVTSFGKYVGGSATNICVGAARLGLRTALVSGVGDDAFGRYIAKALAGEGIDTSFIGVDAQRLTALVALAVREQDDFPRLFYYRDSADMAVGPNQFDWEKLSHTRAFLLTGSYLSRGSLAELSSRIVELAVAHGIQIALDIDFRPVLWGLVPPGSGSVLEAAADGLAAQVSVLAPACSLIVGTAPEIIAATGAPTAEEGVERLRGFTDATIVLKRGHRGCLYYSGANRDLPGVAVDGFRVEVVNTVGAGDGFLAGFLARWLVGSDLEECARWGNACGAIVASRRACSAEMPSVAEVEYFLQHDGAQGPLHSGRMRNLHAATVRGSQPVRAHLCVLAFDHRWQLKDLAARYGAVDRIPHFKDLAFEAFRRVSPGYPGAGILVDEEYGAGILARATGSGYWVGRALDVPGSFPLRVPDVEHLTERLRAWPPDHVAKVIAYSHPGDPEAIWSDHLETLVRVHEACALAGRDFLAELQPSPGWRYEPGDVAEVMRRLYDAGIRPTWWKLPAADTALAWSAAGDVIRAHDPACRGMLVLGSDAPLATIVNAMSACAAEPLCRGFAVGRAIFGSAAERWFRREIDDATIIDVIATGFADLVVAWEGVRSDANGVERANPLPAR
jgi:5-dehydro-2-deoxygluconokinase